MTTKVTKTLSEQDASPDKLQSNIATSSAEHMETLISAPWRLEWDTKMDIALFDAVMKSRPVGMHKHFRMVHIHREYNANSPIQCTILQLWERLTEFFNLEMLDEAEFEYDAEEDNEESMTEFSLPMDDYDQLIAEHRKANSSRGTSPMSAAKSQKGSRKDASPSPTPSHSTASSPEPEESPASKKPRRMSRPPKKSDATDAKTPVRRASRGGGRKASEGAIPANGGGRRVRSKKTK